MTVDFLSVLPEIVVLTGACVILLVDAWLPDDRRHVGYWLAQLTLLIAACETLRTWNSEGGLVFHGVVIDDFAADVLRFFGFVAVSPALFYSRTVSYTHRTLPTSRLV